MVREIRLDVAGDNVRVSRKRAGVQGEGNATKVVISFDESWDGYAKKITWWDALEQNPVARTLTADLLVDLASDTRTYQTTVPAEPLAVDGECTLVIDGYMDGKRARSALVKLEVEYAPVSENAGEPADPNPTQAEQLQKQIDTILQDISKQANIAYESASQAGKESEKAAGSAAAASVSEQNARSSADAAQNSAEEAERQKSLAAGQVDLAKAEATKAEQQVRLVAEQVDLAKAEVSEAAENADEAKRWADVAQGHAESMTVPAAEGVYNVVLQDRAVMSDRYALIVENGVLKLLGVKNTLDAATPTLIDTSSGTGWKLAVENGKLLIEEV